jgi:hypothetical protein
VPASSALAQRDHFRPARASEPVYLLAALRLAPERMDHSQLGAQRELAPAQLAERRQAPPVVASSPPEPERMDRSPLELLQALSRPEERRQAQVAARVVALLLEESQALQSRLER